MRGFCADPRLGNCANHDGGGPVAGRWKLGRDSCLSGTIDYPDESASGALITAITYKEPALHFENTSGQVSYDGTMNKENSEIAGTWKQGAAALSLTLKKTP